MLTVSEQRTNDCMHFFAKEIHCPERVNICNRRSWNKYYSVHHYRIILSELYGTVLISYEFHNCVGSIPALDILACLWLTKLRDTRVDLIISIMLQGSSICGHTITNIYNVTSTLYIIIMYLCVYVTYMPNVIGGYIYVLIK